MYTPLLHVFSDASQEEVVFWVTALVVYYFLPSVIANLRDSKKTPQVLLINLVFGWTIIGWFWSLRDAITDEEPES